MNDQPTIADATAIILTGGKSSRMGRPKALLTFAGEPLVAHIVRKLKKLFSDAVVVAAPEQELPELPAVLVRDEVAYQGPVSGIYHGLRAAPQEICFVTSCDAPFLNLELIAHMVSRIINCDVVVPYWQERFQPLHAAYRRSVAPLLREQLDRGELRPISLYPKVRTCEIHEDEIRRFDPEGLSFINMNSPQDYEAALQIWQKPPPDSISVSVELFGVARILAKTQTVSLSVPKDTTLAHVLAALAKELPVLLGRVVNADGMVSGYACNINGLDFVRDPETKIHSGDKVLILSADAGG